MRLFLLCIMNGWQEIKVEICQNEGKICTCTPTTEQQKLHLLSRMTNPTLSFIEPEVEQQLLAPLPSDFQLNVLTYSSTNNPFRLSRMD